MKIVFQINGGIGKSIAATAVCKATNYGSIFSGCHNVVNSCYGNIFGGSGNCLTGCYSSILGGCCNSDGGYSFVGIHGCNITAQCSNMFHTNCLWLGNLCRSAGVAPAFSPGTVWVDTTMGCNYLRIV